MAAEIANEENTHRSLKVKSLMVRLLNYGRDLRAKQFVQTIKRYSSGAVVDVGGGDFFLNARRSGVSFKAWTTIELDEANLHGILGVCKDPRFNVLIGDGCNLRGLISDNTFDTLINSQVLEHVMEPIEMVKESARILKPGGYAIMLLPQTSVVHQLPYHYYNFTRFWIEQAMPMAGLKIVELESIGGVWTSHASHMVFLFIKIFRGKGMSYPEAKRNAMFWILLPVMIPFAILSFFVSLFFGLGDLNEEPNNHIVVAQKPIE